MPRIHIGEESYDFDWLSLTAREAVGIQRGTGLSPRGWQEALAVEDPEAWIALAWVLRRRAGEDIALADVDFAWESCYVEKPPEPADPTPAATSTSPPSGT